MVKIERLITTTNRTVRTDKKNEWIVIHYVGAVSTAKNNALYFSTAYRGASAHYFVDENEIWQVVEDKDDAWHVGGAKKYYNGARNSNSIGIEMCCKKKDGEWYIEPKTIENTIELTRYLKKKYGIQNITTHYETTHKICPEPFVRNPELWEEFKAEVNKKEDEIMLTLDEAMYFLNKQGIIDKPDHWKYMCENVKDLQYVFIKCANAISKYEAED